MSEIFIDEYETTTIAPVEKMFWTREEIVAAVHGLATTDANAVLDTLGIEKERKVQVVLTFDVPLDAELTGPLLFNILQNRTIALVNSATIFDPAEDWLAEAIKQPASQASKS
jgi:hypothetical protein